jgi:hypothetical protein
MSGKRQKYTLEFREQAARLVIETGLLVAHVATEIGFGLTQVAKFANCGRRGLATRVAIPCRRWRPMSSRAGPGVGFRDRGREFLWRCLSRCLLTHLPIGQPSMVSDY